MKKSLILLALAPVVMYKCPFLLEVSDGTCILYNNSIFIFAFSWLNINELTEVPTEALESLKKLQYLYVFTSFKSFYQPQQND